MSGVVKFCKLLNLHKTCFGQVLRLNEGLTIRSGFGAKEIGGDEHDTSVIKHQTLRSKLDLPLFHTLAVKVSSNMFADIGSNMKQPGLMTHWPLRSKSRIVDLLTLILILNDLDNVVKRCCTCYCKWSVESPFRAMDWGAFAGASVGGFVLVLIGGERDDLGAQMIPWLCL